MLLLVYLIESRLDLWHRLTLYLLHHGWLLLWRSFNKLSILILGPLFDLVISASNKLVTKEKKDTLSASFYNLSANAFEWVTLHINRLDRFMEA